MAKKRIVKDYDALSEDIVRLVKMKYPSGFSESLLSYTDKEGKKVSALPFETDEVYYLIRMTVQEAKRIIKDDDDYDDDGILREDFTDGEVEGEYEGDDDAGEDFDVSDEDDHIIVTKTRDDEEDYADDTEY